MSTSGTVRFSTEYAPWTGMSEAIERVVGDADAGCRVDVFLGRQPELESRSRAKALIQAGLVQVDGRPCKPGQALEVGQRVGFHLALPEQAEPREPAPAPELRVLYADPFLAAVVKPAGISSHPPESRRAAEHTVSSLAVELFGDLPLLAGEDRPGIVHRLDKETTGVMVLARNEEAFHFLRAQFKARTAHKEYRCISYGESRFESDWVERNVGVDPRRPDRMAVLAEGGREAATYYEVVERFEGFTHFRCLPRTGRTHQIRVHMTSVGHSLVGDRLYRSRKAQHDVLPEGAPDPGRQCLHALRLKVRHPKTHEEMEFEAPMPEDMEALLRWLRANRPPGS